MNYTIRKSGKTIHCCFLYDIYSDEYRFRFNFAIYITMEYDNFTIDVVVTGAGLAASKTADIRVIQYCVLSIA